MNMLVLCTGNSARSILLEAILNHEAGQRVHVWSAGPRPEGSVHPQALALLRAKGIDTTGARSKSWEEFAEPDAPRMDIVLALCGESEADPCPPLAGAPVRAEWRLDDPAAAPEADQPAAFARAFATLERRASALLALPLETLDAAALTRELDRIGRL